MKEKLLLLHGALGSKNQFNTIKDKLQDFFEVHVLNFEGHGGRETRKAFSIKLFTENVIHYLEEASIEEANIFGYSMGGYVALNTALSIPPKIKKIMTLGTKFKWDIESAEKEVKMLNPIKIEEKVPHFAEKLKREHQPQDWKIIMEKTASMMLDMANGAKLEDADFKKIKQPVTIGIGTLDNMVSYEESEQVAKLLPHAKLMRLNDVKHPIEKIATEELLHYILSNGVDNRKK